jgi:hypothetical protein
MWSCGKAEFGQISRSFALNSGAIRLKRPKNLTQIGFPSLRSVKSDRLLAQEDVCVHIQIRGHQEKFRGSAPNELRFLNLGIACLALPVF